MVMSDEFCPEALK